MSPETLIWLVIAAVGGADCVLLMAQGLTVTGKWFAVLSIVALYCISVAYRRRAPSLAIFCAAIAQMAAFTQVGAVLTYAAMAASPFPMADAALGRADAALGFDWLAWSGFVNARPVLHAALKLAYASIPVQGVVLIGYFSFRQPRHVHEFLLAAMLSIIVLTPIMLLLPAVGEPSHHANGMTEPWARDILALRAHTLTTIDATDGIVFFPSFHTVLGVLLANLARSCRWFAPVLVLNLLLIASVPTEGAHYGVDLLSGLGLAFAALAATQFVLARCSSGPAGITAGGRTVTQPWAEASGAD